MDSLLKWILSRNIGIDRMFFRSQRGDCLKLRSEVSCRGRRGRSRLAEAPFQLVRPERTHLSSLVRSVRTHRSSLVRPVRKHPSSLVGLAKGEIYLVTNWPKYRSFKHYGRLFICKSFIETF